MGWLLGVITEWPGRDHRHSSWQNTLTLWFVNVHFFCFLCSFAVCLFFLCTFNRTYGYFILSPESLSLPYVPLFKCVCLSCLGLSPSLVLVGGQGRVKCSTLSTLGVCWKLLVQPLNTVIWHIPTGRAAADPNSGFLGRVGLSVSDCFGQHEGSLIHLCAAAMAGGSRRLEIWPSVTADTRISTWQEAERILQWPFEIKEG